MEHHQEERAVRAGSQKKTGPFILGNMNQVGIFDGQGIYLGAGVCRH
jgi:hypothetical protein